MANLTILSRTIDSAVDQRFVLANGQCARRMAILDDWTQLRVGWLLCVNGTGNITGTPRLALGLSSGVTNLYGSASCDLFVGALSTITTWTYTAGSPSYYGSDFDPITRDGSTNTTGSGTLQTSHFTAAPTTHRTIFVLEFTKGDPNWTLQLLSINNVGGVNLNDVTPAAFREAMESGTLAGMASSLNKGTVSTARTVAVNEPSDGLVDAVMMYWSRTTHTIEISEVDVLKLA